MNIYLYPRAKYAPNHREYFEHLKVKDLIVQDIVIDQEGNSFKMNFREIFVSYEFHVG